MNKLLLLCLICLLLTFQLSAQAINQSVQNTNVVTFANGSGYLAPSVTPNTLNNPIGQFKLTAYSTGYTLTSVKITFTGTYSNITAVKLWSSATNSFAAATKLDSTQTWVGSTVTLSGSASSISTSGTYYFVSLDLGASTGSISATIAVQSDIVFSPTGTIATFTNAPLSSASVALPVEPLASSPAPHLFALNQNYPNPFNPTTAIQFSVEKNGKAVVKAFDLLGREVATLYNDVAQAGKNYTATFDGSRFASGVYLYSIESNNQRIVKKMLMLK
jgi:hypothetical protein